MHGSYAMSQRNAAAVARYEHSVADAASVHIRQLEAKLAVTLGELAEAKKRIAQLEAALAGVR